MSATYDAGSVPASKVTRIARRAAGQHGVISRSQALACGFSARSIDRKITSHLWERLYPGVYRLAGAPATWHQSLMAACLAWGAGAVISHAAAAALWMFPAFPRGVAPELTVARGLVRQYAEKVHRPMSLPAADRTQVDGIPVTTPARTLLDIAAVYPIAIVEDALDDALRRKLVTVRRMQWRLREWKTATPGRRIIAKLLAERSACRSVPQSVFETRLLRELRRARLPLPVVQHEVRTAGGRFVLDLAYVEQKVGIEADGYRWHSSRRAWDSDRSRTNALQLLGWTLVRVTWSQLRDRADDVTEQVRAILADRH